MKIQSTSFAHEGVIPSRYTCDGADVSPPLTFADVPESAVSLALIMDDPDAPDPAAPKMTWVHWVIFDLDPNVGGLEEAAKKLPGPAQLGTNSWNKRTYGGPCPPIGRHRYYFKLFALDTELDLESPSAEQLEEAMTGHIVARAVLMGTYQRGS